MNVFDAFLAREFGSKSLLQLRNDLFSRQKAGHGCALEHNPGHEHKLAHMLPCFEKAPNEQYLKVVEHFRVLFAAHHLNVFFGEFEGRRLKADVPARTVAEEKVKVNVNDAALRCQQDIAVVAVFDLQQVAHETVGRHRLDKVLLCQLETGTADWTIKLLEKLAQRHKIGDGVLESRNRHRVGHRLHEARRWRCHYHAIWSQLQRKFGLAPDTIKEPNKLHGELLLAHVLATLEDDRLHTPMLMLDKRRLLLVTRHPFLPCLAKRILPRHGSSTHILQFVAFLFGIVRVPINQNVARFLFCRRLRLRLRLRLGRVCCRLRVCPCLCCRRSGYCIGISINISLSLSIISISICIIISISHRCLLRLFVVAVAIALALITWPRTFTNHRTSQLVWLGRPRSQFVCSRRRGKVAVALRRYHQRGTRLRGSHYSRQTLHCVSVVAVTIMSIVVVIVFGCLLVEWLEAHNRLQMALHIAIRFLIARPGHRTRNRRQRH
mmetsp:Transcript_16760/g.25988  ORF Transcript_16760/g.25988 Transcript_16760/m.25988 type:complete len:493 (-) Transcript_16760:1573-3051(-)